VLSPLPTFLRIESALKGFVTASSTQDQGHIKPMHKYGSLRLVLEGGFLPEELTPRSPLKHQLRGGKYLLSFDFAQESSSERAIIGGVKSKNVDVVINKDGIGPVIAISIKGTGNAFRNLTNRMEEIIGDCANIHMMYPGLVYGFLHLIKANRAGQPKIGPNDICIDQEGNVVVSIVRWHTVLSELTGRRMLSDDVMRYEAIALILAETVELKTGDIFSSFPLSESPLLLELFFRTLYSLYDLRFSYKLATNLFARRVEWHERSTVFSDMIGHFGHDWDTVLGYSPRLASS
jgi:hypothetical protein